MSGLGEAICLGEAIWLCLRFEQLPLEIFSDRDDSRAVAVVAQRCVQVANREPLEPGMAVNTAFALYPDLLVLERQPAREAQTLCQLAHWAYQITPEVVVAGNNSLLLEVGSCRRLHGDLSGLLQSIEAAMAQRGHSIRAGWAHTPKAAWLMARLGAPPALADNRLDTALLTRQLLTAPVAALPITPACRQTLLKMGLTHLEPILRLPRASLRKRLGAEIPLYLQQLCGQYPDPQPAFVPQPVFDQSTAFIDGVIQRHALLFPMKRLILSLCDYLQARHLKCRTLRWRFSDAHCVRAEMTVELSRAHNHWRSLLELSQLKLDAVELPEAVFTLALYSDTFFAMEPANFALFAAEEGSETDDESSHALIDRLRSRLGSAALQRLSAHESLWPEAASSCLPMTAEPVPVLYPSVERPAWLLPKPVALRSRGHRLWWNSALELVRGPERIAAPVESGAAGQQRDYYVAREADGRLCWIYREVGRQRWFVHGLFG